MFTLGDALWGILLPAATTAVMLLAAWRLTRRKLPVLESRSWAAPPAVGFGFAAGWTALFGWGGLPPLDSTDWLPLLAVALAAVGLAQWRWQWPLQARVAVAVAAVVLATWLLARPLLAGEAAAETRRQLAACVLVQVVWIVLLDRLAEKTTAANLSAILLAAFVPAATTLLMSGSQKLGQATGVLAAAQLGVLLAGLVSGRAAASLGMVPLVGVLYSGLLLCGYFYASLTATNEVLLLAAPQLAWLPQLAARRLGPWPLMLLQVLLVGTCAMAALLMARSEFVTHMAQ